MGVVHRPYRRPQYPRWDGATSEPIDYPTEETLERIRTWPLDSLADFEAGMDFAGAAWSYPQYWAKERGWLDPETGTRPCLRYMFSTGGWSGNESIVNAIEANTLFQIIGAWSWRRGGHYEYRFPMEPIADEAPPVTPVLD